MQKLATGVSGAVGSKYLKNHNQLVFTEFGGFISKIDLVPGLATIVSQGTTILKGTWVFDCETGANLGSLGGAGDVWWEQITNVQRRMTPQTTAQVANLGIVDFNSITPASIQSFTYSSTPIPGNNDPSNKLVTGDVFCVKTNIGNYCKIKVLNYDYNMQIQWVTYKLNPAYVRIGNGYSQPEDIVVASDEQTAYVTERTGNLLRVNLTNANRAAATVVCSGLNQPQQLFLDQAHNQAYVVEFGGNTLTKINLATGVKTIVFSGLSAPVGLILSADLAYAYITEQGINSLTRITLGTNSKVPIATALTAPFFLTWADDTETRLLVPERDPANRITLVDVTKTTGNKTPFISDTAVRPSSIAVIQPGTYAVFADAEVDEYFLTATTTLGLYKGIGYVPWNLITGVGKADTTTQPAYPFQFAKDSPFGGTLPINIDHYRAFNAGIAYYMVKINGNPRFDTWNDLMMNPINGKYEIIVQMKPDSAGFYPIHNPVNVYYNSDLGCLMDSTSISNGQHPLTVEFYTAAHVLVTADTMGNQLFIDNNKCIATLDMPLLGTVSASPQCGYLKYTDKTQMVDLHYTAYHPMAFANYSFSIIKGANGLASEGGALLPNPFDHHYTNSVANMLGTCPTVAAFAEYLYVATTVINGVGRQSQYDASASVAFCLAP